MVSVQLPSPVPPQGTADVTVDSHLALAQGIDGAQISPGATVLLPSSVWFPLVNTQFILYGANTAPVTMTIAPPAGEKAVSGGVQTGNTFTQPLFGLPFFITGDFGAPVTRPAAGLTLEAWFPDGAPAAARSGADRLARLKPKRSRPSTPGFWGRPRR